MPALWESTGQQKRSRCHSDIFPSSSRSFRHVHSAHGVWIADNPTSSARGASRRTCPQANNGLRHQLLLIRAWSRRSLLIQWSMASVLSCFISSLVADARGDTVRMMRPEALPIFLPRLPAEVRIIRLEGYLEGNFSALPRFEASLSITWNVILKMVAKAHVPSRFVRATCFKLVKIALGCGVQLPIPHTGH